MAYNGTFGYVSLWCRRVRHRLRHRGEARREPSRGYADSSRHDLKGGWLLAATPWPAAGQGGRNARTGRARAPRSAIHAFCHCLLILVGEVHVAARAHARARRGA